MINNKITIFSTFILVSALGLATVAAYFSIVGIAALFSGAIISVGIMAGFLELGKLCSVSFVYRYWKEINRIYKTYFILSILILTTITSGGIGGFLLSAYQSSSLNFTLNQNKITSTESSKEFYFNQIKTSNDRIKTLNDVRKFQETRLSEALTNTFLVRNPIQFQQIQQQTFNSIDQSNNDMKSENVKIVDAKEQIQHIDERINQMKLDINNKKDIQTFKFLADALGTDLDTIAKWFITSLIFVFDPLAIALILAYNVMVFKKNKINTIIENDQKNHDNNIVLPNLSIDTNLPIQPVKKKLSEHKPQTIEPVIAVNMENPAQNSPTPTNPSEMNEYYRRMFKQ